MNKFSILQDISDSKKSHLRWLKRAKHLVQGLSINKDFIPRQAISCSFGKWLYNEGEKLRKIESTRKIIDEIEFYHNDLHDVYSKIYKIFFIIPLQKSLLSKVLTFNSKKTSHLDQEKAKVYFKHLQETSLTLIDLLTTLEEKIQTLNYKEMQEIIN